MPVQGDSVNDIIKAGLAHFDRMSWTLLANDIQDYVMLPKLLKKEKVKIEDGHSITWDLQVSTAGAARFVGLGAEDEVNIVDGLIQATIPWRHVTTNYAFVRQEVAMNSSPAKIVDLIKTRRVGAMLDMAEKLEEKLWSKPTDSTDTTDPFGVKYWIVNGSSSTGGFNGTNPSGFSAGAAGVSSTTYPNWANWNAQFTNVTKTDLVTKWREAAVKTKFKAPVDYPALQRGDDRYGYYTNYDNIKELETIGEQQNENLGRDIASMDGKIVFRGIPITWVPQLDSDTADPVYGINWSVFYPVILKDEYLKEDGPFRSAKQHTVSEVHIDMSLNLKCCDRRRNFVINK